MRRKATHRLIDSVWTIEFEPVVGGKVRILNYSREDKEGYEKEKQLPQVGVITEGDDRIVKKIVIRPEYKQFGSFVQEGEEGTVTYEVANPKYIFDYKGR